MARLSSQQSNPIPPDKNQRPPEAISLQIDASRWGSFVDCLRKVSLFEVSSPSIESISNEATESIAKESLEEDVAEKDKIGSSKSEERERKHHKNSEQNSIDVLPTTAADDSKESMQPHASVPTGNTTPRKQPKSGEEAKRSSFEPTENGAISRERSSGNESGRPLFLQQGTIPEAFSMKPSGGEQGGAAQFHEQNSNAPTGFQVPEELLSSSQMIANKDAQSAALSWSQSFSQPPSSSNPFSSSVVTSISSSDNSGTVADSQSGDRGGQQQDPRQGQNQRHSSTSSPDGLMEENRGSNTGEREGDADSIRKGRSRDNTSMSKQIDRVRLVQRVSNAFRSMAHQSGTVRIKLHPEELGSITVRIQMHDGAMAAKLETETEAVQRALLEHLPELRERLGQQNIKIESFQVSIMGQQEESSSFQAGRDRSGKGSERNTAPSRRRSPGGSRSNSSEETSSTSREPRRSDPHRQLDVRI
jgi:hypothetical protein